MTDPTPSGRPPTPDYHALSVGDIAYRVRSLSAAELERLLEYERSHAARAPVLDLLSARLAQLEAMGEGTTSPHGSGNPRGRSGTGGKAHRPSRGVPQRSGRPEGDEKR
ncbi:hypothetical protein [Streptomyces sp. TR06-5]|uniref:hypothetical protein n=1 Tax=unclassified Streptomyces TaxID=2593676 RepID=UPI0039A26874